jgi:LCP family protein required for cell wall assembly
MRNPFHLPRSTDPLWARLLVVSGAVVMLLSGVSIVGVKVLVARSTAGIDNRNLLGGGAVDDNRRSIEGTLNVLLVGIDQRPDNLKEPIRSDSIIVLHIPRSQDRAYLVSIPRDLLVDVPAYPKNKVGAQRAKINAAFALGWENGGGREGGFELLAMTVVRFNAGAIVDFGGFSRVVEQLGGVDMCIDQRVVSRHIGWDKNGKHATPFIGVGGETRNPNSTPMVYEPGCRHLKPWEALDYVRQRKGLVNGDYDRQRHQQQFLKAIVREAKDQGVTSNPLKAVQVMNAAGRALMVDTQGVPIETWAFTLRNITDNELTMLKTNGGKVNSVVDPVLGSCEVLTPESREMFEALKTDRLDEFVLAHPDFVNAEATAR